MILIAINAGKQFETDWKNSVNKLPDVWYYRLKDNAASFAWLLRAAALASFDRWANSTAVEEFFDTEIGLRNYLENNQLYIYKDVLRSLSEEYEEMYRVNYED